MPIREVASEANGDEQGCEMVFFLKGAQIRRRLKRGSSLERECTTKNNVRFCRVRSVLFGRRCSGIDD